MADTVWAVWIGAHDATLGGLFSARELAEQYATDRDARKAAIQAAFYARCATDAERAGDTARAKHYRDKVWQPECSVEELRVHDTLASADAELYADAVTANG